MNKYKTIILILIIIFLCGCSNKLTCKIKTDTYKSKIKVIFKNNRPAKYIKNDLREFNIYDPEIDIYYNSKIKNYKDVDDCKIKKSKDYVYTFLTYNFDYDSDVILINKNDSYFDAIKKIESSGYICK